MLDFVPVSAHFYRRIFSPLDFESQYPKLLPSMLLHLTLWAFFQRQYFKGVDAQSAKYNITRAGQWRACAAGYPPRTCPDTLGLMLDPRLCH